MCLLPNILAYSYSVDMIVEIEKDALDLSENERAANAAAAWICFQLFFTIRTSEYPAILTQSS